jgi:hypothetical protein
MALRQHSPNQQLLALLGQSLFEEQCFWHFPKRQVPYSQIPWHSLSQKQRDGDCLPWHQQVSSPRLTVQTARRGAEQEMKDWPLVRFPSSTRSAARRINFILLDDWLLGLLTVDCKSTSYRACFVRPP